MTPEQTKAFLDSVLKTLSEEFEQDARNETDHSTSRTLDSVAHRIGSVRDDLDWHMREALTFKQG